MFPVQKSSTLYYLNNVKLLSIVFKKHSNSLFIMFVCILVSFIMLYEAPKINFVMIKLVKISLSGIFHFIVERLSHFIYIYIYIFFFKLPFISFFGFNNLIIWNLLYCVGSKYVNASFFKLLIFLKPFTKLHLFFYLILGLYLSYSRYIIWSKHLIDKYWFRVQIILFP